MVENTDNEVGASLIETYKKKMVPTGIFVIVLFTSSYIDLFGVGSASGKISRNLFQRVFSGVNYSPSHQSNVSVYLINDEYLQERKLHWPLDYLTQLKLFSEILQQNPKAMFIDLLYQHPHETFPGELTTFVEGIQKAAKDNGDIPIVIPKMMSHAYNCATDNRFDNSDAREDKSSLLKIFEKSSLYKSYTNWEGCGDLYPLFLSSSVRYPSPALMMYSIACEQSPIACITDRGDKSNDSQWLYRFKEPMDVQWGVNVSQPLFDHISKYANHIECQKPVTGSLAQADYALKQSRSILLQGFGGKSDLGGLRATCPYTDTFYANWGIDRSERLDDLFSAVIKDRYVFIGASLTTSPDYIQSPVNGQIAGVYLHAMAFDNLLTYGTHYIRPLPTIASLICEIALVVMILLMVFTLVRQFLLPGGPQWGGLKHRGLLFRLVVILTLFVLLPLLVVLIAAATTLYLGYSPLNWISVLSTAAVTNVFIDRDSIKWAILGVSPNT